MSAGPHLCIAVFISTNNDFRRKKSTRIVATMNHCRSVSLPGIATTDTRHRKLPIENRSGLWTITTQLPHHLCPGVGSNPGPSGPRSANALPLRHGPPKIPQNPKKNTPQPEFPHPVPKVAKPSKLNTFSQRKFGDLSDYHIAFIRYITYLHLQQLGTFQSQLYVTEIE